MRLFFKRSAGKVSTTQTSHLEKLATTVVAKSGDGSKKVGVFFLIFNVSLEGLHANVL